MRIANQQNQAFMGYKVDPKNAGKFLLKKKEFQFIDTLSFVTALTSMTGFAIGGVGLLSDYLDKSHGKNPKTQQSKTGIQKDLPKAFSNFETAKLEETDTKSKKGKDDKKEGAKTIVPSTKFSKMALVFAKIGIAFSGIAGIFNGISMGLPLMAAGESLNLAASPIVETPLGTGLFGVALAAVFSGRALENDPMKKMDKVKLSQQQGLGNKVKYIASNMKECAIEVWRSGKVIGNHLAGLFKGSKRPEALAFFKDNVFSIKPKQLVIQEFVDSKGVKTLARSCKSNPYLMHGASMLLAAGGLTLALCSLIKNRIGQKVGLKTYEVGGSLDNLSLSRWGMEKAAIAGAGNPTARAAGYLLGASGLTILAGQPGVDEKWGRGTQWVGTALLFAVFAVERYPKAFKNVASKELKSLVRQWEIDLPQLYSRKELKQKLVPIVKSIADDKEIKDESVSKLFKIAEGVLSKDKYFEQSTSQLLAKIQAGVDSDPILKKNFDNVFKHFGNDGNIGELKATLKYEGDKKFQTA